MFSWLKNIFSSSSIRVEVTTLDGEKGIATIHYSGMVTKNNFPELVAYVESQLGMKVKHAKVIG